MRNARHLFLVALLSLVLAPIGAFAATPSLPDPSYATLGLFSHSDTKAAQKAWQSQGGSTAPSVTRIDGKNILTLPCTFRGSSQRSYWDLPVKLDLTTCRGVQFKLFCADPSPVSHFTFYLKSGRGWYAAAFECSTPGKWQTVIIDKSKTDIESSPAGWANISAIRIAAWRGSAKKTTLYIADLGMLDENAEVAIIRGDSTAKSNPGELGAVTRFAEITAQHLTNLGISHSIISDNDVTAARLRSTKLIILPHNPEMPNAVATEIAAFIKHGGKMISFYGLPPQLESTAGIKRGKYFRPNTPGHLASMRRTGKGLAGQPETVGQNSWNIYRARPNGKGSRIVAYWHDEAGKNTDNAAIIASDNTIHMTHVLMDDYPDQKRELLLSMVGTFLPDIWKEAAFTSVEAIGRFGPYQNSAHVKWIAEKALPGNKIIAALLSDASEKETLAMSLLKKRDYAACVKIAGEARDLMLRVHCSLQKPIEKEQRLFWCHNALGVDGMTWDQAIKILADNGFTAVLPNMLWGGVAFYQSTVLPVAAEVSQHGDQIAKCLSACRKYGIECHVWKVNWNMSRYAPDSFVAQMKKESRIQVKHDGTVKDRWLCPSHPKNRELEINSLLEVVKKYDVDGIHMDYIRYPDSNHCFCNGCRSRFEKNSGSKISQWPADVRNGGHLEKKWLDFRRSNIDAIVKAVSRKAHKIRPNVKVSAAVWENWPSTRDSIGQDWKMWCDKGYLDFVCPMDYTENSVTFKNKVQRQLGWSGKTPCYPGIGLSTWTSADKIVRFIDQVNVTRTLKTGGFTVFDYGVFEAKEIAPLSGLGLTASPPSTP